LLLDSQFSGGNQAQISQLDGLQKRLDSIVVHFVSLGRIENV